jgi:hypothetical protein
VSVRGSGTASAEQRASARNLRHHKVFALAADAQIHECLVTNMSGEGACFLALEPSRFPDDFALLLQKDGGVLRQCRVVWRMGRLVGVRFVSDR